MGFNITWNYPLQPYCVCCCSQDYKPYKRSFILFKQRVFCHLQVLALLCGTLVMCFMFLTSFQSWNSDSRCLVSFFCITFIKLCVLLIYNHAWLNRLLLLLVLLLRVITFKWRQIFTKLREGRRGFAER